MGRMIKIWEECVGFQTTNQRLTDQDKKILKNGWFCNLEILGKKSVGNQDNKSRNKLESNNNRNNTHSKHIEQTLTQEETITENGKRIMSEKKTRLPSQRNQDWKTVQADSEINK